MGIDGDDEISDYVESDDDGVVGGQIDEYDLTSSPNDFNVSTIFNFIESGSVKIPAFQRNYVWDLRRASVLIESLIIGLPVPQVFLYEQARNSFLVIDGQQRLMTIYYFMRGRFPRPGKRAELRRIFDEKGGIPDDIIYSSDYFTDFRLKLPEVGEGVPNKFDGLSIHTLGEYHATFTLRTIRNIIVKQVKPDDGDSSIFEMFNRLNTGGVLLTPQEIRATMYHSDFLTELSRWNLDEGWRELLNQPQPDLHMRDVETLLRGVAMWKFGDRYRPSMSKFLNKYARSAIRYDQAEIQSIENAFRWFLEAVQAVQNEDFWTERERLVVGLFDAVFAAACAHFESEGAYDIPAGYVAKLSNDEAFRDAADTRPTDRRNVVTRLERANDVLQDCLNG